jgi:hypothetical protein
MSASLTLLLATLVFLAPHASYPVALAFALLSFVLAIFLWVIK